MIVIVVVVAVAVALVVAKEVVNVSEWLLSFCFALLDKEEVWTNRLTFVCNCLFMTF